jgi:hypothetical protein
MPGSLKNSLASNKSQTLIVLTAASPVYTKFKTCQKLQR